MKKKTGDYLGQPTQKSDAAIRAAATVLIAECEKAAEAMGCKGGQEAHLTGLGLTVQAIVGQSSKDCDALDILTATSMGLGAAICNLRPENYMEGIEAASSGISQGFNNTAQAMSVPKGSIRQ